MIRVDVLGGFRVSGLGAALPTLIPEVAPNRRALPGSALSEGSQRLIAALALRTRPADRGSLAAELWPEAIDGRAASSLRSAIARLGDAGREVVDSVSGGLALHEAVVVDIRAARSMAARLLEPRITEASEADITPEAVALFSAELLPDWFDSWLESPAEEWQHLRVNALEAQSDALRIRGRLHEASSAARRAIEVDLLRETAQRCLIAVHLAAGNQSDALHSYDTYRTRLDQQLGLQPTSMLSELVSGMNARTGSVRRRTG